MIGPRSPTPEEESFPWVEEARRDQIIREESEEDDKADEDRKEDDIIISNEPDRSTKQDELESRPDSIEPVTNDPPETKIDESYNEEIIHQFALEYVKDIISKATVLASEREATFHSLRSELSHHRISRATSLPWFERLRQIFRRLVARACLCKTKHDSMHSFKES